jgi:hypothetical protein
MSVSASSDSAAEASVLVLEDTHDFDASDGTRLWQIGFVPIDEDGDFLPEKVPASQAPVRPLRRLMAFHRLRGGVQIEAPGRLRPIPEALAAE